MASETELQRHDLPAAREALEKARCASVQVTDELEAGRIAALAGRIALSVGDVAQAETDLQVAQEIFMRLGANLDLRRVEDALKRRANVRIEAIPALVGAQR